MCARLVGGGARKALRGELGEDLLEPQTLQVAWREEVGVAFDDLFADLFGVAAGGYVGAGEQHLPAAGRDRHESIERHRISNGPRRHHQRESKQHDRCLGQAGGPIRPPATREDHNSYRQRDRQILGTGQRERPEQ